MSSRESRVESQEPDELPESAAPDSGGHFWMLFALLVVAAATLLVLQARRPELPGEFAGLPLPPLESAGWLNTNGPLSADDLRGKVVLVNFWATDCSGCVLQIPSLAAFHERFRDRGVLVVGLTPESNELGRVKQFLNSTPEMDWPIAYGAGLAFEVLGIQFTPTYILYDRTGRSVWGAHTLDGSEDAAIEALARK